MLRKTFGSAAVLGALAAATALCATGASAADKQNLNYSQWLPPAHWTQPLLHKWYKEVSKATGGRVNIRPTAKTLGAPPRQYQLLQDGIADVVWHVHGYTPGSFPLTEMAELPFITKSGEANSVAYWRVFKKMFEPAGMHNDIHTLTLFLHVPGHVFNNKRKLETLADFEGLKIRIPNQVTFDALQQVGAIPIAAPVTKLRDGLAKGVFDGTAFTNEAIYGFKIGRFVKFATQIPGGLYNLSFLLGMNKAKWQKVSAEDQATVMTMAGEVLGGKIGRGWDERDEWAPSKLREDGVVWNTLSGQAFADFKAKLAVYEERWIDKAKKAGVDGEAALKMFRAEIDAHGS